MRLTLYSVVSLALIVGLLWWRWLIARVSEALGHLWWALPLALLGVSPASVVAQVHPWDRTPSVLVTPVRLIGVSGVIFPDGTIQTTAATSSGAGPFVLFTPLAVQVNSTTAPTVGSIFLNSTTGGDHLAFQKDGFDRVIWKSTGYLLMGGSEAQASATNEPIDATNLYLQGPGGPIITGSGWWSLLPSAKPVLLVHHVALGSSSAELAGAAGRLSTTRTSAQTATPSAKVGFSVLAELPADYPNNGAVGGASFYVVNNSANDPASADDGTAASSVGVGIFSIGPRRGTEGLVITGFSTAGQAPWRIGARIEGASEIELLLGSGIPGGPPGISPKVGLFFGMNFTTSGLVGGPDTSPHAVAGYAIQTAPTSTMLGAFFDRSESITSLKIEGSHAVGLDLLNATISDTAIKLGENHLITWGNTGNLISGSTTQIGLQSTFGTPEGIVFIQSGVGVIAFVNSNGQFCRVATGVCVP